MPTIIEVCRWCDISPTTLHKAVKRGVITRKPRGEHDIREVARALIKDGQAAKGGHGDLATKLKLSEARAALAREQTAALKLKNAVARHEYVSREGAQRGVETILSTVRERLLSLLGRIAPFGEMYEQRDIEQIVREEVCALVDELSGPILLSDGPIE